MRQTLLLALASITVFLPVIEFSGAGRRLTETFAMTHRLIQMHDSEPEATDKTLLPGRLRNHYLRIR